MLAKGGKVLDDLADMGYVVPELAEWVGPTSAEVPQGVPQQVGEVPQGGGEVPQEVPRTLAGAQAAPERLAITQQTPSYGQGLPGYPAS